MTEFLKTMNLMFYVPRGKRVEWEKITVSLMGLFLFAFAFWMGISGSHAAPADQDDDEQETSRNLGGFLGKLGAGSGIQAASGNPDPIFSITNTSNFVNEFTGHAAFNIPLGSVFNHGDISYSVNINYYAGGLEHTNSQQWEFSPTSWVGQGFSLKAPYILANTNGTVNVDDDKYSLSLDGVSSLELVPEKSNPSSLYPKNNPYINVTRVTGGNPGSLYQSWVVTLSDGTKYHFISSVLEENCIASNFCLPVKGPLFHDVPLAKRAPMLWYLTRIESKDGDFGIFFEYDKVEGKYDQVAQGVVADRAVYLSKIKAVNGNSPSSETVSEIIFNREPKTDFVDPSSNNPLAQFETQRLKSVEIQNQGEKIRQYNFHYTTSNERTRLEEIKEISGEHERRYYRCTYDETNPWQVEKVFSPSGLTWEYGYGLSAVDWVSQQENLDLNGAPGGENFQIGFTGEFNGKYYVLLSTRPDDHDDPSYPINLYEFENRGTYWKLERTYKIGGGAASSFSMAPDGSYFTITGGTATLSLYDLTSEWLDDKTIVELADPEISSDFQKLNEDFSLTSGGLLTSGPAPTNKPARIFTFGDWLAIYQPAYGTVRFFMKNSDGNWGSFCPQYTDAMDPYVFSIGYNFDAGLRFSLATSPCLTWMKGDGGSGESWFLDVRQGNNFIAIVLSNTSNSLAQNGTTGGAIRIFSKISEEIKMINKPQDLEFPRTFIGGSSGPVITTWGDDAGRGGFSNRYLISDVSIHGEVVSVFIRKMTRHGQPEYLSNKFLYVFAVNLAEEKFERVYSEGLNTAETNYRLSGKYSPNDNKLFMARNFMLFKQRDPGGTIPHPRFKIFIYHFDRIQKKMKLSRILPAGFNTTVRIFGDYFFVETLDDENNIEDNREIFKGYRQVEAGEPYPLSTGFPVDGKGKLYKVTLGSDGLIGDIPPDVKPIPIPDLNQFTLQGDRFLAYDNINLRYVYGRINEGGITSASGITTTQIADAPIVGTLSPTGVISFNRHTTSPAFNFFDDFKGGFLPEAMRTVSQVKVLSKGESSNSEDGTEQTIQFNYNLGNVPNPQFNTISKVPNFKGVKRILVGPSSEVITNYAADFESSELEGPRKNLHGVPLSINYRPGSQVSSQPGERETTFQYTVEELPNAINGETLEGKALVTRLLEKTDKTFNLSDAFQTSESRFTDFNTRNGRPQVVITKQGTDFQMDVTTFDERVGIPSRILPIQTASYLFSGIADPCTDAGENACSSINVQWFLDDDSRKQKAVSSQVFVNNSDGEVDEIWSWRSKEVGTTGLQTLDGSTAIPSGHTEETAGKWILESEVLARAEDEVNAISKHNGSTQIDRRGVRSTIFYGGIEGRPLAVAENTSKTVCSFLGAEEEYEGVNFGAFGDWESPFSSVSEDMAQSGTRSIKVTGATGPTTNIHYKQDAGFWSRQKGFHVSGWIFVPGTDNGDPAEDPMPAAAIDLRESSSDPDPIVYIDLIADYESSTGNDFPYNQWVKLERLVTWEDLNSVPGSDPVMIVWFGKEETLSGEQNMLPVYLDEIRIHPTDATMISRTYDKRGRVTSFSDLTGQPIFPVYSVWDVNIGTKDNKGRLFSATAAKRVGEK